MTFFQWVIPLLDYYKYEAKIFTDYIRPNKRGTFSVRNAPSAQARFGSLSQVSLQGPSEA